MTDDLKEANTALIIRNYSSQIHKIEWLIFQSFWF